MKTKFTGGLQDLSRSGENGYMLESKAWESWYKS